MPLVIPAYAKINLCLDVLGRRDDGYHEVEMVMQSISLHDLLELSLSEEQENNNMGKIILTVAGADLPVGEENLVFRTARILQEYTGCRLGCSILLHKKIPVAAGLAGGSADAAAALLGLNKLWNLDLTVAELYALAAKIGSDVPFCIKGGTVLAKGRGEQLAFLEAAPDMGIILVKPAYGISTGEVYSKLNSAVYPQVINTMQKKDITNDTNDIHNMLCLSDLGPPVLRMIKAIKSRQLPAVCKALYNILEEPAMKMHPNLLDIKNILFEQGAMGVLMSGSGSTIFGITPDLEAAHLLSKGLSPSLGSIYAVKLQGAREV
ncbi:4-diphosphocytidyl-2C-methyl-D-erythritolkinase [Desulfofarcimen acetoxidans DSM 771]|uniref:4-diphosphocytidyl-2-C-methyl-D-erythritol kinase n=1 Tax=Desulfofarcimen acetoxidans (strain ATCC 49208 / DSM 771 / KCTC 5769 / VKM B-1644 / 5575) TaxID=485916 RepID=C8W2Z8_DESAS|nr:4-(cytidine 5'-diphospho)-2-C-methyl-D-erythritol kinase [Desulfofarcimen acetoxidans]ACV61154.1 4-diphosphocytidyl-2C-methyl-D-erythritolkinase [Desulfofarcimen acetoxidans DSM 771]